MNISGAALYGGVRALQDAETQDQTRKQVELDRAAREEELAAERALRPMRLEAAQLGLDEAKVQAARRPILSARDDEIYGLNLKREKQNTAIQEANIIRADKIQKTKDAFDAGLQRFSVSKDPQYIADAISATMPMFGRVKANRTVDNNGVPIVRFDFENGKGPLDIRETKDSAGRPVSIDEQIQHLALNGAAPSAIAMAEKEHKDKIDLEDVKRLGVLQGIDRTNKGRLDAAVAGGRASADSRNATAIRGEKTRARSLLSDQLKTQALPGGFLAGFANPDDPFLVGSMQKEYGQLIDNGMTAEEAVPKAVDKVRTMVQRSTAVAAGYAAAAKDKFDPRKIDSVREAAKAGNPNAASLLKVYDLVSRDLGEGVARHVITSAVPRK